jgi:ribosomal RNA-processing protein 8
MGTDYPAFLAEAARLLKTGGHLWVAEVRSRFAPAGGGPEEYGTFLAAVRRVGLAAERQDASNKMFVTWIFRKRGAAEAGWRDAAWPALRPCLYKRR